MPFRTPPPVLWFRIALIVGTVAVLAIGTRDARAFPTYSGWWGGECVTCHGDFRASRYRPPSRDIAWTDRFGEGALHGNHWEMVDFDCDVCHLSSNRAVVYTDESRSADFPLSCIGCHGRAEHDAGGIVTGAGLRRHHWNAGVACTPCHPDSEPGAGFIPVGENEFPPNYDAFGIDPCNYPPDLSENFAGSTLGLDNDGDYYYDIADSDCDDPPPLSIVIRTDCGLGVELALILPPLLWLRRRVRSAAV